jgi:hypothetical protein
MKQNGTHQDDNHTEAWMVLSCLYMGCGQ